MTTVSALALSASIYGAGEARAMDADRPTLWIELGGQSEQVRGFGDPIDPPFTSDIIADGFKSPLVLQRALGQSFGEDGKISFQPENSDWILSASIRYGRANGGTTRHDQTAGAPVFLHIGSGGGYQTPSKIKFSETQVDNSEVHTVLDFQVGKDIGLGLFGSGGKSTISFGVRFAQFTSNQILGIKADPDEYFPTNIKYVHHHHTYAVSSHMERSFRGVGPSISWDSSAPLIGDTQNGGITLDWGVNAAVLFGRQKARGHHQSSGVYYKQGLKYHSTTPIVPHSGNPNRSRSIMVPNVGGFAGLSFRYPDAKISLGYRGDFFFGAMDGGIDARKSTTRGFNGPFASISFGLGD